MQDRRSQAGKQHLLAVRSQSTHFSFPLAILPPSGERLKLKVGNVLRLGFRDSV